MIISVHHIWNLIKNKTIKMSYMKLKKKFLDGCIKYLNNILIDKFSNSFQTNDIIIKSENVKFKL